MLGAIVGDIVGSIYEFDNHRSKDFPLFTSMCSFTDDTVMTLAIAKALMESKPDYSDLDKLTIKYMQSFGALYPDCTYGLSFADWLKTKNPKPYNSYGNGAAMRVSAVGFIATSLEEVIMLSKKVTEVTHNHPEGVKGAEATAVAIYLAKTGSTIADIKAHIENHYYKLNFTLDEIRDDYEFNETCQDTVPQAIKAFLESTNFEDAIRNAISIGGDSDTLAAITGGIAEAYYGVPKEIHDIALKYLDEPLLVIFKEFEKKVSVLIKQPTKGRSKSIKEVILTTSHVMYGNVENAYRDKLVVTSHSLSYYRKKLYPEQKLKWSYRDESLAFKEKFDKVISEILSFKEPEYIISMTDCGSYTLTLIYEDGTRKEQKWTANFRENDMWTIADAILDMIPDGKPYPELLLSRSLSSISLEKIEALIGLIEDYKKNRIYDVYSEKYGTIVSEVGKLFDPIQWYGKIMNDIEKNNIEVQNMNFLQIRGVMTWLIRGERWGEGFISGNVHNGYLLKVINRLKELVQENMA